MIRTNSAKNTIVNPAINHKFADEVDSCRTSAPLHRNKNLVFEFLFTHGWRQGAQQVLAFFDKGRQRWAKLLVTSDRATHGHPTKSVNITFDIAKSWNTKIAENN